LEDHEKFRDNEDNIFEVEVRGVRNEEEIFFKGQDVEKVFNMEKLLHTLHNNDSNYFKGEDYEILLTQDRRKLCTFITKKGIQKILSTSRSIAPSKIQKFLDNPFILSIR